MVKGGSSGKRGAEVDFIGDTGLATGGGLVVGEADAAFVLIKAIPIFSKVRGLLIAV